MPNTKETLAKLGHVGAPHVAYKDHTLRDLFAELAQAADLYIHDLDTEWPDMDKKPHAMLYKAKVFQQYINEINARAKVLLEEDEQL